MLTTIAVITAVAGVAVVFSGASVDDFEARRSRLTTGLATFGAGVGAGGIGAAFWVVGRTSTSIGPGGS